MKLMRQTTKYQSTNKESGQMAIFIALIFQVLFVLFAMIINVGMIVHDKINLQNSVDLAAYYAAQRQAEQLNAIAHSNYQIRQAWKLLSWRVRVLGDLGNDEHPMNQPLGTPSDTQTVASTTNPYPTVCIKNNLWENNGGQNLCHSTQLTIPEIPSVPLIAAFLPWNIVATAKVDQYKNDFNSSCNGAGPANYEMAVRWISGFRMQVRKSKVHIREIADMMSSSASDFRDIRGDLVSDGVQQTLLNNLTRANRDSLGKNFHIFNSLASGGGRKNWLNEIVIYPNFPYIDFAASGPCAGSPKWISMNSGIPNNCSNCAPWMETARTEPPDPNDEYHSILGFEKNPWAMAYVGVTAQTAPTKPFLPFGKPITLTATAFAQPFGGRVGPWMYKNWQTGAFKSSGNFPAERVDQLVPEPVDQNQLAALGSAQYANLAIPNYSRFPGDSLGLRSKLALTVMRKSFLSKGGTILLSYYAEIPDGTGTDNLPQITQANIPGIQIQSLGQTGMPWIREYEVAAMAPDLFDITYFSIDPRYAENYIPNKSTPLNQGNYDWGANAQTIYTNIENHIAAANAIDDPNMAFYMVNDKSQLLTAWLPTDAYKYFPTNAFPELFGVCKAEGKYPVPGCAQGGRVGYSVRIISRDYLKSNQHKLGGPGAGVAAIMNPPPDNF